MVPISGFCVVSLVCSLQPLSLSFFLSDVFFRIQTSAMDSTMLDDLDCSGSLLAVRYTWENGSTVLSCPPSSSSAVVVSFYCRDLVN